MKGRNERTLVFCEPQLTALGLVPSRLVEAAAGWPEAAATVLAGSWQDSSPASGQIFPVGRSTPLTWPDLERRQQFPVPLHPYLAWMDGDRAANVLALVRAALAEDESTRENETIAFEPLRRVLVVGQGLAARLTLEELARRRFETLWVRRGGEDSDDPAQTADEFQTAFCRSVIGLKGFAGKFRLLLENGDEPAEVEGGAVVFCGPEEREPLFLDQGAGTRILRLSEYEAEQEKESAAEQADRTGRVIFLAGLGGATSSGNMARMIRAASREAQRPDRAVYILAPQIKVAEPGLERSYGLAREAGVTFFRTSSDGPVLEAAPDGRLKLKVYDAMARANISLSADLLVVEEHLRAGESLELCAEKSGVMRGEDGFLAPDNVLFLPVGTNRRGVLALGAARGTDSPELLKGEILAMAAEIEEILGEVSVESGRLSVDRKRCTICLTCVRICPYQALGVKQRRPYTAPLSCVECGLCAAECPMNALQLEDFTDSGLRRRIRCLVAERPRDPARPRLIVFGCRRSAETALAAAPTPDQPVDMVFISVPCAGKLEEDMILSACLAGADGIMVAACHEDNCRTHRGNVEARRRTGHVKNLLEEAGFSSERLRFFSTAPNMGLELGRAILEFYSDISKIGVTGLAERNNDRNRP